MTPEQTAKEKIVSYISQQILEFTEMAEMHKLEMKRCKAEGKEKGEEYYKLEYLSDLAMASQWKLLLECYQ